MEPVFDVAETDAEGQAAEIEHVVEREGRRRDPAVRVGLRPRRAVGHAADEQAADGDEDRGVAKVGEVFAHGPRQPSAERDDAKVKEGRELVKNRDAILADDSREQRVLLVGDDARRPPLVDVALGGHRAATGLASLQERTSAADRPVLERPRC